MREENQVFSDTAAIFSMTNDVHGFVEGRIESEPMSVQLEGRSFGAVLSGKASNSHELLRSKAAVVNVMVKRRDNDRVMWGLERRMEMNRWGRIETPWTTSEPELPFNSGKA